MFGELRVTLRAWDRLSACAGGGVRVGGRRRVRLAEAGAERPLGVEEDQEDAGNP